MISFAQGMWCSPTMTSTRLRRWLRHGSKRHRRGRTISLVAATHVEAQRISESIQARRIESGAIQPERIAATGQDGQPIFVGDVVQTRRNDSSAGVQNRQNWILKSIAREYLVLVSVSDSSDLRKITHEYAASHLHLAYATTVYGAQGETTDLSLVGPGVDAAGLYVGLTRGKHNNVAVLVATTEKSARSTLVEMMQRRPIEETLQKSQVAARSELNRAARDEVTVRTPEPQTAAIGIH